MTSLDDAGRQTNAEGSPQEAFSGSRLLQWARPPENVSGFFWVPPRILIMTFQILHDLQHKTFLHFINRFTFDHNRYLINRDYVWIISCFFNLKPYVI